MKPTFIALLALCLCLGGCGKKEPVQPSATKTEATKPEKETGKEATQPTKPERTKAKATAGVKLWEFETGGRVPSSPAIGSDGSVRVDAKGVSVQFISRKGAELYSVEWSFSP